jgi:hypothetical protein
MRTPWWPQTPRAVLVPLRRPVNYRGRPPTCRAALHRTIACPMRRVTDLPNDDRQYFRLRRHLPSIRGFPDAMRTEPVNRRFQDNGPPSLRSDR